MDHKPFQSMPISSIFLLLFSCFVATNASAQAKNFEGFDLNLISGFVSLKSSTSAENLPSISIQRDSPQSNPFLLSAGYTAAISESYTVGASVNFDLTKSPASNVNVYSNGTLLPKFGSSQGFKNREGLAIKLGYALDPNALAYSKFGYSWASTYGTNNDGSAFNGDNIKFTSYAVGLRVSLDTKLFTLGELNYNQILLNQTKKTIGLNQAIIDSKSDGYSILIGLGYLF
jgi:hypothetical protein